MAKGVHRLREIAGSKQVMEKAEQNLEYRQLIVSWVKKNYVIVVLQVVGAIFGTTALVQA